MIIIKNKNDKLKNKIINKMKVKNIVQNNKVEGSYNACNES